MRQERGCGVHVLTAQSIRTYRRTSGYCSGRASPENDRRTGTDEERGQGKVRGHFSSSKRRTDDNITVRRRNRQSRSHSSDRQQRQSAGQSNAGEHSARRGTKSLSRETDPDDTDQATARPHRSRRSSSRRSRHGCTGRRCRHSDGSSSDENSGVTKKLHRISPKTFDGIGSFESFLAHFENCAEYNGWKDKDKLAHLNASFVSEAAQVLWDSGEKSVDTLKKLLNILRHRYS